MGGVITHYVFTGIELLMISNYHSGLNLTISSNTRERERERESERVSE